MLIWTRAHFDNLVYTIVMLIAFVGLFVALAENSPLLGAGTVLLSGFIFLMAVIWKS